MDNIQLNNAILTAPIEKCSKCGSPFFKEVMIVKKISSVLTGTGKPGMMPIPVYVCEKCGEVLHSMAEDFKRMTEVVDEEKKSPLIMGGDINVK